MRNSLKRAFAFLLAGMMIFSVIPANAFAEETTKTTVTVATDLITTGEYDENSDALKTKLISADTALTVGTKFYVPIILANITEFNFFELKLLYDPSVLGFTDAVGVWEDEENLLSWGKTLTYNKDLTFDASVNSNVGMMSSSAITATTAARKGYLMFAGFEVVGKSATGTEEIGIQAVNEGTAGIGIAQQTAADQITYVAGTVSVEKEATSGGEDPGTITPSNFEIYYTLDSTTDNVTANYKDYEISNDANEETNVVATIGLKNNTDTAVTLQAYDIYLTYGIKDGAEFSGLKYASETMGGAAYIAGADVNTTAQAEENVTHIEAIGDSFDAVNLPANSAVTLGTVTFTIDKTVAQYGQPMYITLTQGSVDQGEDTTNISIANTATVDTQGDKKSYYPTVIQTVDGVTYSGAEVVTKYDVTFNANGGTNAPNATVKYYNQALTLDGTEPSLAGHSFKGWTTDVNPALDANIEYAKDGTIPANVNKPVALYAVWEVATADYTVEHWQQNVEGTAYVKVDTETKTGQTGADTEAAAKTYEGFTAQEITQGTIAANGSTVVNIYYDRNTYEITIDKDNGSETETITGVYGETVTKPADPEKEGHTFVGWDVDGDGQYDENKDKFPTEMPVVPEEGLEIKAIWSVNSYTVKFATEANGTLTNADEQTIAYGSKLTTIPTATANAGYTFVGWYAGDDMIEDINTYTVSGDVTLTAKYTLQEYEITFDANGGNLVTSVTSPMEYDITSNKTLPTKDEVSKTGYTFDGWKVESAAGNWDTSKTYSGGTAVTGMWGTVKLIAQWSVNPHAITVETVGKGSVEVSAQSAKEGDTITLIATPASGYTFTSYTVIDENNNPITVTGNTFTMPNASVTVTVTFTATPYNVTVNNPNEGTITVTGTTDGKATVGTEITLSNDPVDGYKLVEYTVMNTTTNTEVSVTDGKFTMPASNVTVTATFQMISYEITYDLAGGALAEGVTNPTTYTVTTENFTLNNPTKVGYTFAGWTGSNGDTAQEAVTITKGTTGELTYTANWTAAKVPYTVNHWQQNLDAGDEQNGTNYTIYETEKLKADTDSKVTPNRMSYEGFAAPEGQEVTIAADGSTVVNYYYTRNEYTITATANNSNYGTVTAPTTAEYGSTVTLGNNPVTGYEFDSYSVTYKVTEGGQEVTKTVTVAEDGTFTMPAANVEVVANFKATQYEITFDLNGGTAYTGDTTITDNKLSYTIESTTALPGATRSLYTFAGWKVKETVGSWTDTSLIDAGTQLNRNYGNVTLIAQWAFMEHDIEDYKYAYNPDADNLTDGYKLLRVKDNFGDQTGMEYKFGDKSMYYTTDTNYLIDSTKDSGVFFLLIEEKYVGTDNKLNANGEALLSSGAATSGRATLIAAGENKWDINSDGVVNIADANVVYQMTLSGGSYYSDGENGGQLDNKHRLMADLVTARNDQGNDHRASIKDVNAIVNHINGVVETTNP